MKDVLGFFETLETYPPGSVLKLTLQGGEARRQVSVALEGRRSTGVPRFMKAIQYYEALAACRDVDQMVAWLKAHPDVSGDDAGVMNADMRHALAGDEKAMAALRVRLKQELAMASRMLPRMRLQATLGQLMQTIRTKEELLQGLRETEVPAEVKDEMEMMAEHLKQMTPEEFEEMLNR